MPLYIHVCERECERACMASMHMPRGGRVPTCKSRGHAACALGPQVLGRHMHTGWTECYEILIEQQTTAVRWHHNAKVPSR